MPEANVCDYKDLHIERTVHSGDDVFIYVRTIIMPVLLNEPNLHFCRASRGRSKAVCMLNVMFNRFLSLFLYFIQINGNIN